MLGITMILLFVIVIGLVGGFESGEISSWMFVILEMITMSAMASIGSRLNRKWREQDRKEAEAWKAKIK